VIDMNETRLCALEQLRAFLEGRGKVRFQSVADDEGRYSHLQAAAPTQIEGLTLPAVVARLSRFGGYEGPK
jgi:hypothetical protein